jgi:hypothetical protein
MSSARKASELLLIVAQHSKMLQDEIDKLQSAREDSIRFQAVRLHQINASLLDAVGLASVEIRTQIRHLGP